MRKEIFLLFVCIAGAHPASGETDPLRQEPGTVFLNEVLADAPGPDGDGGGEWIELFNCGTGPVELGEWVIGDRTDAQDRLEPWKAGGSTLLGAGGLALVLDPDGDPSMLDLPAGVLILRPDDSSLGNGLRAGGERIHLLDPSGALVDTAVWGSGGGDGISWERIDTAPGGTTCWKPCRATEGSTPGRVNSWTEQPGDRSVTWRGFPDRPLSRVAAIQLAAVLRDEGNAGLSGLLLEARATHDRGFVERFPARSIARVAPGDSAEVDWDWLPTRSGRWVVVLRIIEPPSRRNWSDTDSMKVDVSHPPLSRVLSEAQPRPVTGKAEWLEFWSPPIGGDGPPDHGSSWECWSVRVRSLTSPCSPGRSYLLPGVEGSVLLVTAGDPVRMPDDAVTPITDLSTVVWKGLRLSDTGSIVTLADPTGTTVDSAVLRPAPGLPRGHTWQRWYPDFPGWSPDAWGLGRSIDDITPGWVDGYGVDSLSQGIVRGFELRAEHRSGGSVKISWSAPAPRIWIEVRLHDMSGRLVETILPRILAPGVGGEEWDPGGRGGVSPGIYLLVCMAEAAGSSGSWKVRRVLGVRP